MLASLARLLRRRLPWRRPVRLDPGAFAPWPEGGVLVGGAVRDALLGRPSRDLDWLVQDPQGAAAAAARQLQGSAFALDEERGHWRVQAEGRTLDFIALGGPLEGDLRLRDFTVNAMAAGPDGRVIDPLGGMQDLRARRLRLVSESALAADPLRLLRAVRLSAELGFSIAQPTDAALGRAAAELLAGRLRMPAWERIRDELELMVTGPAPAPALARLQALGLLEAVLPELAEGRGVEQGGFHHLDVLDHSLEALHQLTQGFPEADPALRWATLLHDVGKPPTRERDADGRLRFYGHDREGAKIAARALRRLRFGSARAQRVAALVRYHMLPLPRGEREARRFVHRRRELLPDLLKLMIADREAARGRLSSEATRRGYRAALSRVIAILEEVPEAPPLLDGREVMTELGLASGPRVGEALRFLKEAQAVGDVSSREEALSALRGFARARGWIP